MFLILSLLCGSTFGLQADLNSDHVVNVEDLAIVCQEWLLQDADSIPLRWDDDLHMASKHRTPRAVFNDWLIGGSASEMALYGIIIYDGQFTQYGGKIPLGLTVNHMWGIPNCGVFCQATSSGSNQLLKSKTGFDDFSLALEPQPINRNCLPHSLVDCGRHVLNNPNDSYGAISRRVLLYFEYPNSGGGSVWYSAEPEDTDAGNAGTWYNLFGSACAAIRHFHGAMYVKGKGLYVFTGDTGTTASRTEAASVLFCSKDDIDDLIENAAVWYNSKWCLAAGSRANWVGTIRSNNIFLGNTPQARTVDLVTADGKVGYYIPDSDPQASGNSIIRVNFSDTSQYDCGSYSYLKSGGVQNFGWYGAASKSGLVYISTIGYWGTDSFLINNNPFCEIWCIDPISEQYNIVKRIPRQDYDPARGIEPVDNAGAGMAGAWVEYGGAMFGRLSATLFSYETGDTDWSEPSFCGKVSKEKVPAENFISNPNFADGFSGWTINDAANYCNRLAFTGATAQIIQGDTLVGAGGASAVAAENAVLTGGAWDGTGSGHVRVTQVLGVFVLGETISGSTGTAVLSGFNTCEIIDDPTGQVGGKVLRIVQKSSGLPNNPKIYPVLTTAQKRSLEGAYVTLSCKIYIAAATDDYTTVDPELIAMPTPGSNYWKRAKKRAFDEDQWHTLDVSCLAAAGATSHLYAFYPDYSYADGNYLMYYVTDFELVKGAIPNFRIAP